MTSEVEALLADALVAAVLRRWPRARGSSTFAGRLLALPAARPGTGRVWALVAGFENSSGRI
jgi:hypothetical protein